jgi:hypothetical protein
MELMELLDQLLRQRLRHQIRKFSGTHVRIHYQSGWSQGDKNQ